MTGKVRGLGCLRGKREEKQHVGMCSTVREEKMMHTVEAGVKKEMKGGVRCSVKCDRPRMLSSHVARLMILLNEQRLYQLIVLNVIHYGCQAAASCFHWALSALFIYLSPPISGFFSEMRSFCL